MIFPFIRLLSSLTSLIYFILLGCLNSKNVHPYLDGVEPHSLLNKFLYRCTLHELPRFFNHLACEAIYIKVCHTDTYWLVLDGTVARSEEKGWKSVAVWGVYHTVPDCTLHPTDRY